MPSFLSPEPTVSYFNDLDYLKDFENEFPAIVYNDALTSKSDFLAEPIVNPQHIDELNETSLSECDEEEQNVLYFNDLFPFNVIYPDVLKSGEDNDGEKDDTKQPTRDIFVISSPDKINTDVYTHAHRLNKLLKTSHDTSRKIFKSKIFIEELNIMHWNHIHKGKTLIFINKNLYLAFPLTPSSFIRMVFKRESCRGQGHAEALVNTLFAQGLILENYHEQNIKEFSVLILFSLII
ncbi:hypothetical protein Tco_0357280 [Tanacetum coccineum]